MDRLPEGWRSVESTPVAAVSTPLGARRVNGPALALGVVTVVLLAAAGVVLATSPSGNVAAEISGASSGVAPGSAAGSSSATWKVDVTGGVQRPGLYGLRPGSRVADAIRAAGGYAPTVDTAAVAASLNLAEVLHDGAKVLVPVRGSGAGASGSAAGSGTGRGAGSGRIDLNSASAEELDRLPGIGPATAAKIIAARTEKPFSSVDELLGRKLVRATVLQGLRDLVTVGGS